ncbi:MAG: glycosyltransferase family 4 protein [Candidatus Omnitrophica bacterium]|nr:glycosyltransferase family 4 protein [Candidatus Omnitrophota bacterium]
MKEKQIKIQVLHLITRMIVGGAQENTLLTVNGLKRIPDYELTLLTGPSLGPEGELLSKSSSFKIKLCHYLRRNINPLFDFIAFCQIYSFIKKNKFDIVHTHSSKAGILGRLAAKLAGTKIIIHTIHGLPFFAEQSNLKNKGYIALEKFVARFTQTIICVSQSIIDQAVDAKIAEKEKFVKIYSGIELIHYKKDPEIRAAYRKRLGIPANSLVIGKLARLFNLKGHDFLLDAAVIVKRKSPKLKILFIGDGILRNQLEKKAKKLGLSDNLIFTGLIRPEAVPYYLQCVDVLAHTSLHEGLPRAVVQSFALEIPAVCFNLDGAKDIIRNQVNGILVSPKNIQELANALSQLLGDKKLRQQMGAQGNLLVREAFGSQTMVSSIDFVYRRLLKSLDSKVTNKDELKQIKKINKKIKKLNKKIN